MGFTTFRMGHAHKTSKKITARAATPNPSCFTGGFYKVPANGATIDSLQPLDIEWDTTCLTTDKIDIHLLAPGASADNTELAVWPGVLFADGKHTINIHPKWWNATHSINVQLSILPSGTAFTTLPAGPVLTATYTPPADGSIPASADVTKPDTPSTSATNALAGSATHKSLPGGKTAAAVILPLLCVALGIFLYLRYQRRKAATKSHRFSQAIDKRMSTISTDWKSMSAAGAQAAIRSSMAVSRDSSASAFAFGAIRPMSGIAPDMPAVPHMTQVRTGTGVGLRNPNPDFAAERASRASRVSFADTVGRPSGESRRTRALHSAYVPPLPTMRADVVSAVSVYPDSEIEKKEMRYEEVVREEKRGSPTLSPRQATGPLTLTPEDIRARIHQGRGGAMTDAKREQEAEYDEVMPALSMMRTGLEPATPTTFSFPQPPPSPATPAPSYTSDLYLFHPLPAPPAPAHSPNFNNAPIHAAFATTTSPPTINTAFSTPASPWTPSAYAYANSSPGTPAAALSPDDMLRAYAERKAASASAPAAASPSSFNSAAFSPKVGKRKLSLRASFGIKGLKGVGGGGERAQSPAMGGLDKSVIGRPMQVPAAAAAAAAVGMGAGAGMAGVGARAGAGVGAQYAIGEDEEEDGEVMDWESAYVGTAN